MYGHLFCSVMIWKTGGALLVYRQTGHKVECLFRITQLSAVEGEIQTDYFFRFSSQLPAYFRTPYSSLNEEQISPTPVLDLIFSVINELDVIGDLKVELKFRPCFFSSLSVFSPSVNPLELLPSVERSLVMFSELPFLKRHVIFIFLLHYQEIEWKGKHCGTG